MHRNYTWRLRRLSYLVGEELGDEEMLSDQDDTTNTVCQVCTIIVGLWSSFYYISFLENRRANGRSPSQIISDVLAGVLIIPSFSSFLLTMNVIAENLCDFYFLNYKFHSECPVFATVMGVFTALFSFLTFTLSNVLLLTFILTISAFINVLVMFLAIHRFLLLFHFQCAQSKKRTRLALFFSCFVTLIYKTSVVCYLFYATYEDRLSLEPKHNNNMALLHSFANYTSLLSACLVFIIYGCLFHNLMKQHWNMQFKRPETTFLWEGVPFLLGKIFIFYHTVSLPDKSMFLKFYQNNEMRSAIITTAILQFSFFCNSPLGKVLTEIMKRYSKNVINPSIGIQEDSSTQLQ